jgi:general secretion pathway protein D
MGHRHLRSILTGLLLAGSVALTLSACITSDQSLEADPRDPRAQDIADKIRGLDLSPRGQRPDRVAGLNSGRSSQPAVYLNDEMGATRERGAGSGGDVEANGDGFDLNFENAPVSTVAKVILGDILGVGYSIDPRVQGTVTLASGRPIPKNDTLFVLENALRMSNVALIRDRGNYRLIPSPDAVGSGSLDTASAKPGFGISVVPLRYVSAQNVLKLLDTFGVKASAMRADASKNIVLVQGTGSERRTAMDTILSFDADWMKGQSVGVFPVRNSSPEPIIAELEKIMDSGEGGLGQNMVKLQAVNRQNAILVVSQKPEFLKRAGTWIARLDKADTEANNLKVYPLRNGNARQVAALLNDIFLGRGGGSGSLDSASSQVGPGLGVSVSSSGTGAGGRNTGLGGTGSGGGLGSGGTFGTGFGGTGTGTGSTGIGIGGSGTGTGTGTGTSNPGGFGSPSTLGTTGARGGAAGSGTGDGTTAGGGFGGQGSGNGILPNVRITADVANNSILVYANQESQRIVEQTLRQLDRPQRQVAIEATIAEVTLNDQLNYGVQFFLASQDLGMKPNQGSVVNTIGNAATNAVLNRVLPGFNLLVGAESSPRMVLDALHGITNVKVLSNPSLVVLDNQVATLQVGDQVPVSTGTATVLSSSNTVVSTIEYRNTGIILRVLPRSNASGNIVLDIEQEISNVTPNADGSTTLTPTVSQRRVKSSVAVNSGQTVLLAGLISEREDRSKNGIPLLDQIPGLGDAFAHQNNKKARTELILFIRPTIIRDSFDAHLIAEELRTKISGRLVGTNIPVPVVPAPDVRPR